MTDAFAPYSLPLRREGDAAIVDAAGETVLVIDPDRHLEDDQATAIADHVFALSAPAAPQAAGVGELTNAQIQTVMVEAIKEVRETVTDNVERAVMDADVARMERGPVDMGTTGWAVMRAVHRRLASLRAPLREPEGGAVKLRLKMLDTLKPFAEVAEKLKHCHVVEICEPTPDNPSRNIIPMPREWFERAADDLEAIAIQLHGAGALSEGQASKLTGLDRVEVRKLADALATREEAPAVPDDVRRLVEAARVVAFEDQGPAAIKALDVASEAFADRVPWEGEPYEEAPAEAGAEGEAWKWIAGRYPNDAPSDLAYDANEMVDAFMAGRSSALRAQPPAREGAQPVAVKTLVDAALTYIAGRGHAPGFGPLGKLHEAAWAVKKSPLYTHPAPDALREVLRDRYVAIALMVERAWTSGEPDQVIAATARKALAALQAGQGAK